MTSIKQIHHGLPLKLQKSVFWVGRTYRTHPLSHKPGGSDVVVEYRDGTVLGYDWIKKPSYYVARIFSRRILKNNQDLRQIADADAISLLREEVQRIYVREILDSEKVSIFEEVWNDSRREMPWDLLKPYDRQAA